MRVYRWQGQPTAVESENPMAAPLSQTRPRTWLIGLALVAGALVFASCGGDDTPTTAPEPEAAEPETETTTSGDDSTVELEPEETELVSFSQDIQPVVTATCARCHTGDGLALLVVARRVLRDEWRLARERALRHLDPESQRERSILPGLDDNHLDENLKGAYV